MEVFRGRAGAFGQEDVGAAGAVIGSNRAGDNHGRKGRVQLLGAADEFVAVHLRHKEITEQQVERAG